MDQHTALNLLLDIAREKADKLKLATRMVDTWDAAKVPETVRRDARRYQDIIDAISLIKESQRQKVNR